MVHLVAASNTTFMLDSSRWCDALCMQSAIILHFHICRQIQVGGMILVLQLFG